MRIALVHDYLYTYGGAERVLETLCEIWPKAPIYTAWVDWQWLKKQKPEWQKWTIITSWFDKVPLKKQLCSPLRFLAPKIWNSFARQLSQYDIVISSSAWYICKGVSLSKLKVKSEKLKVSVKNSKNNHQSSIIPPLRRESNCQSLHVCYCHTPPRYLYGYPTALEFRRYWWGRLYARIINPFLRIYDYKSSQTIDYFICNSKEVQKRIWKFYRRKAKVIYPPIFSPQSYPRSVGRSHPGGVGGEYFLMVNRLVRHKNIDLAIKACKKLKSNLKIVGVGPDRKRLKKIAGNNPWVQFLGYVDDQKLAQLYTDCRAVLYLADQEDFGITPVEAMAYGKPVIALKSGGVKESIINGKTGIFINKLKERELIRSLKSLKFKKFKVGDCLSRAKKFSKERFKKEMKEFILKVFKNKSGSYC